eukprot:910862-Amphidinium_carterae.1
MGFAALCGCVPWFMGRSQHKQPCGGPPGGGPCKVGLSTCLPTPWHLSHPATPPNPLKLRHPIRITTAGEPSLNSLKSRRPGNQTRLRQTTSRSW